MIPFPELSFPAFIPPARFFFLLSYSKEKTAGNRKLSKWIATADTAALLSPRRNVQSTSLACQQLETQKWRPWKLLTFGGNIKGALERWGRLGRKSSLCFSFLLQLSNPAVFLCRGMQEPNPKHTGRNNPRCWFAWTQLVQKPLSRAVHISQGLIQSPVKLMASLPRISKDLGSKHCIFDSQSWKCWRVSALNPALHSSILIAVSAVWWSTSSNLIIQVPPVGEGVERHFGTSLHPRMNSWRAKAKLDVFSIS